MWIMHPRIIYEKSAVFPKDFPTENLPEIAIIGRSNAGKSSFLNGYAHSQIAKVSKTAGKTRLLNFFMADDAYRIVDMPGYGYAARSHDERDEWKKMVETYFSVRGQLQGCVLIMDIRRDWHQDEKNLMAFCASLGIACCVALTKIDKLTRNQMLQRKKEIMKDSGLEQIFLTSALKKIGHQEIEDFIYEHWIKTYKKKPGPHGRVER